MPHPTRALLLVTLLASAATPAAADNDAAPLHVDAAPLRVSIDSDPSTFAFGGFSGWAMAKLPGVHHVRIGAGGFGLDFPRCSSRT